MFIKEQILKFKYSICFWQFAMTDIENNSDYVFELNGRVELNAGSDSWREIPVKKDDEKEMLPGTS